jgi:hypothetical protein
MRMTLSPADFTFASESEPMGARLISPVCSSATRVASSGMPRMMMVFARGAPFPPAVVRLELHVLAELVLDELVRTRPDRMAPGLLHADLVESISC